VPGARARHAQHSPSLHRVSVAIHSARAQRLPDGIYERVRALNVCAMPERRWNRPAPGAQGKQAPGPAPGPPQRTPQDIIAEALREAQEEAAAKARA